MTLDSSFQASNDTIPAEFDPAQWHQSIGVARQACARIFRDGGSPADALKAFGIKTGAAGPLNWSRSVVVIAETLCAPRLRRAA